MAPPDGEAPAVLLTVDVGNSQAKLRLWAWNGSAPAEPLEALAFPLGTTLPPALAGWLAERSLVGTALCSVASPARTEELGSLLERETGQAPRRPEHGLENLCDPPAGVGADRLFAARGALERAACDWIVVDVGTALTVDAVAGGARGGFAGRFLGGAIAPGPALLTGSLAAGGARLPQVAIEPGAGALGRSTEAAIAAGAVVGLRGAARELVEGVAREAGFSAETPICLGGGARAFLLEPEPFSARRVAVEPELVHRGLLAAWAP